MQHDDTPSPTALSGTRRQQIRAECFSRNGKLFCGNPEEGHNIYRTCSEGVLLVNRGIMGTVPPMGSLAWVHGNSWTNK